MGGATSSHCKGHGFRERWRIGALFTISLLESEWNVKIRIDCLSLSVSLLVVHKEVDGSPQSCLKASCCRERSQPEDKDRTTRIAEGKCHSPHDGVDIWIKPTLPLDFTDTYASKFWYHSSLCDWSFLFGTKRHLNDTAIQPNNSFSSPLKFPFSQEIQLLVHVWEWRECKERYVGDCSYLESQSLL